MKNLYFIDKSHNFSNEIWFCPATKQAKPTKLMSVVETEYPLVGHKMHINRRDIMIRNGTMKYIA